MVTGRRRGFGGGRWGAMPPALLGLLILELVVYILSGVGLKWVGPLGTAFAYLPMDYDDVTRGEVWRLLTYGLLHDLGYPFHLIMTGLVLFFFGRDLEQRFGASKFLLFIWSAVLVGGIFVFFAGLFGIGSGRAIGISAAVEAAVVTWAFYNRNTEVRLFFVMPIKGIYMVGFAL